MPKQTHEDIALETRTPSTIWDGETIRSSHGIEVYETRNGTYFSDEQLGHLMHEMVGTAAPDLWDNLREGDRSYVVFRALNYPQDIRMVPQPQMKDIVTKRDIHPIEVYRRTLETGVEEIAFILQLARDSIVFMHADPRENTHIEIVPPVAKINFEETEQTKKALRYEKWRLENRLRNLPQGDESNCAESRYNEIDSDLEAVTQKEIELVRTAWLGVYDEFDLDGFKDLIKRNHDSVPFAYLKLLRERFPGSYNCVSFFLHGVDMTVRNSSRECNMQLYRAKPSTVDVVFREGFFSFRPLTFCDTDGKLKTRDILFYPEPVEFGEGTFSGDLGVMPGDVIKFPWSKSVLQRLI